MAPLLDTLWLGSRRDGQPANRQTRYCGVPALTGWVVWWLSLAAAIVCVAAIFFLCLSRLVLPGCLPVSRHAWTQCSQVEVRVPFDATRMESFVSLNSSVKAGTQLCQIVNDLPDRFELRDLTQAERRLQAHLVLVRTQRTIVAAQLGEVSEAFDVFLNRTQEALEAAQARTFAELQAALAEHHFAQQWAHRQSSLGIAGTPAAQEEADTRVRIAEARIEGLCAELCRLTAEKEAICRGVPLAATPDSLARKADLELRHPELEASEREIEAELAGVRDRYAAADRDLERRCRTTLLAPCAGRVTWIHASTGVMRANEPVARISQPVTHVEALFNRVEAERIIPGQPAVVWVATGEHFWGRVERFDELSPASAPPGRGIVIPREVDQVRVFITLDAEAPAVAAGVPASVALTQTWGVRFLLVDGLSKWALIAAAAFAVAALALKAGHAHLVNWRAAGAADPVVRKITRPENL